MQVMHQGEMKAELLSSDVGKRSGEIYVVMRSEIIQGEMELYTGGIVIDRGFILE